MIVAANNIAKVIINTFLIIIFLTLLVFDFMLILLHNNSSRLLCNICINFGQIKKLVILLEAIKL
jgi:hypothetical protein